MTTTETPEDELRTDHHLDAISKAATEWRSSKAAVVAAVKAAKADGVPVSHMAAAADVNRTSVYNWLEK